MSDFFNFKSSLSPCNTLEQAEGEDQDYDALNDETFGDSSIAFDWEEDHEQLTANLSDDVRRSSDEETGLLSKRVATVILDDETDDIVKLAENTTTSANTAPTQPSGHQNSTNTNSWWPSVEFLNGLRRVPMCTVEEVERDIRNKVLLASPSPTTSPVVASEPLDQDLTANLRNFLCPSSTSPANVPQPPPPVNIFLPNQPNVHPPPPNFIGMQPRFSYPLAIHPNARRFPARTGGEFKPCLRGQMRFPPRNAVLRFTNFPAEDSMSFANHHNRYPISIYNAFQPDVDEYAGLMSMAERQWLASIQMLQINTSQPYRDDYYFQVYQSRQLGKCRHKHGNPSARNNRAEALSSKPAYTPQQFENSLGKLQVGSVMAPRRMIDMDIVEPVESKSQYSSRRYKEFLLGIEKLYTQLILLEDYNSPHIGAKPDINPTEVMKNIVNTLLRPNKLNSILGINKGKNLIIRLLPRLDKPGPVIYRVISLMVSISRKDENQILLRLLPTIRSWLLTLPMKTLFQLSKTFDESILYVLGNKFTVSVLCTMIERAESVISMSTEKEVEDWLGFISRLATTPEVTKIERPVVGIDGRALRLHFERVGLSFNDENNMQTLHKALSNLQV